VKRDSSPRLTVGLVVHDYDPTFGQGRYCAELVRRLSDHIRFVVFANTHRAPGFPEVEQVHVPALRTNALTTVFSFIGTAERAVRRRPVDILHAQGLTSWSADIVTGHICNAARARRMNTRWLKPKLFMKLVVPPERRFYQQRRASHLIAISRVLEHEVRSEYGWSKPATVIYHGTNSEQFRPARDAAERAELRQRFKIQGDTWTWLFMGEATKGLHQSIEALPAFPRAHLLVVSRSRMEDFRAQAAKLGVTDRVIFHGFERQPELAFRAADLFVYPSDYDPFGMVVTEAMASGMPVCVGKDLGSAELIEPGRSGMMFDPHDPDDIVGTIRKVEHDPHRGRLLGVAGRITVQKYDWDRCAAETLAVYERVHREKCRA
jgi:UDP-glucose:(heptosyl)LPS alpha-1,3-glucosyltransferase